MAAFWFFRRLGIRRDITLSLAARKQLLVKLSTKTKSPRRLRKLGLFNFNPGDPDWKASGLIKNIRDQGENLRARDGK